MRSAHRCRVALLPAAVVLVAGCSFGSSTRLAPFEKPPTVDGARLVLEVAGSSCEEIGEVDVREASTSVQIGVQLRGDTSECDDEGFAHTTQVVLDAPLGDRTLVDLACESPSTATGSCK